METVAGRMIRMLVKRDVLTEQSHNGTQCCQNDHQKEGQLCGTIIRKIPETITGKRSCATRAITKEGKSNKTTKLRKLRSKKCQTA